MSKYSFLMLFSMIAALGAGAYQADAHDKGPGGPNGDNTPSLSWDQFRESCIHPEEFNNQVPPSNIRIQCTDIHKEFVQSAPGQVQLPGNRRIIFAVFSNKYHVNADQREEPILNNKGSSCMRYKEVEKTLTVERRLTCEDVLGMKASLPEFCSSLLTVAKGANPKLVDSRDTGRFVDTCGNMGISDAGTGKPNN